MPAYLISYDLNTDAGSPHAPFLKEAETEGLLYVWQGLKFVSRLPNTTLWGLFASADDAVAAFQRARAKTQATVGYKVIVEKRVVTLFADMSVLSDVRKPPETQWIRATAFETSRLHQLHDPFF